MRLIPTSQFQRFHEGLVNSLVVGTGREFLSAGGLSALTIRCTGIPYQPRKEALVESQPPLQTPVIVPGMESVGCVGRRGLQ